MSVSWERPALIRLEVDEVWKRLGRYGRYQLLQVLTLTVAGMSMAYPVLSVVFEGRQQNDDTQVKRYMTTRLCSFSVWFAHELL